MIIRIILLLVWVDLLLRHWIVFYLNITYTSCHLLVLLLLLVILYLV